MSDPLIIVRLEAYLDQVLAPLTHRLSPFHREELRRELREHLWERVTGYCELGMAQDEAVIEALRQFGGAEDFLRQWHQEWLKTTTQATLREMWAAAYCALLLSLPALLVACRTSHGLTVWSHCLDTSQIAWAPKWMQASQIVYVVSGWDSFALNFVVLPLALGVAVGRVIPERAGIGMLAALTIEIVIGKWLGLGTDTPNLGRVVYSFSELMFICSATWLPLACTTAALTGWWTQRSKPRLLA